MTETFASGQDGIHSNFVKGVDYCELGVWSTSYSFVTNHSHTSAAPCGWLTESSSSCSCYMYFSHVVLIDVFYDFGSLPGR